MRITVIDTDYDGQGIALVVEVVEVGLLTRETFAMLTGGVVDRYSDPSYRWFVSPPGTMPKHAEHNAWGQLTYQREIIARRRCYRCGAPIGHCACPVEVPSWLMSR